MSQEVTQKLLQGALKALKRGDKDLARQAFLRVLKLDASNEAAWFGMATVARDQKEQLLALKKVLQLNPYNPRALAALRKLSIDPKKLLRANLSSLQTPAESQSPRKSTGQTGELVKSIEAEPVAAASKPAPTADEQAIRPVKKLQPRETAAETEPDAPPEEAAPQIDFGPLFAAIPLPPPGPRGIPVADPQVLEEARAEAVERMRQAAADNALPTNGSQWQIKKRRAGEREWLVFQLQVAAAAFAFFLCGGFVLLLLLTAPGAPLSVASRALPTATASSTPTPGITHTPSVTPQVTLTPSPTVPAEFPRGNPTIAPSPTRPYVPASVISSRQLEQARQLIAAGQLEQALPLIESERQATENVGNFLPFYALIEWHLANDDLEAAQRALEQGETLWQERAQSRVDAPLVDLAHAQIALAEARQRRADGASAFGVGELLEDAETRLLEVIQGAQGDGRFVEAYLLLADRYLLGDQPDEALEALDRAYAPVLEGDLLGDTRIRLKRAQILRDEDRLEEAIQELNTLLLADNFVEEAHFLRTELALEADQPARAVKFAEAYTFAIPGRVGGYMLWGDAHLAEGKPDWALQYYTRGLQGAQDDPNYVPTLLRRADLLLVQGQFEQAFADYDTALALSPTDDVRDDVRISRMVAAYQTGDLETAMQDAADLADSSARRGGEALLVEARILLDTDGDPDEALRLLERSVLVVGVPDALRPVVAEYRARALLALDRYDDALSALSSVGVGDDLNRRALRGAIYEARGRATGSTTDLRRALFDYDFVLTWQALVPSIDVTDLAERYDALQRQLGA